MDNAYTALRSDIYAFISSVTPDNTVIWNYQNGTEPVGTYVGIHILANDQIGREEYSTYADETSTTDVYDMHVKATYETLVQVNFYGSQAGDLAWTFNHNINSPYFWETLDKHHLSIMRKTPVRNIPQKRDTQWTDGFSLDLTFLYAYDSRQVIDVIEKVILVNTLTGETITIPE